MSKLSERDEVINFMKVIENRTPILLIEKAAIIFKRIYHGQIYQLNNLDDIELINNMTIAKLNKVTVISDLSFNTNTENIRAVALGKRKQALGYFWSYDYINKGT